MCMNSLQNIVSLPYIFAQTEAYICVYVCLCVCVCVYCAVLLVPVSSCNLQATIMSRVSLGNKGLENILQFRAMSDGIIH